MKSWSIAATLVVFLTSCATGTVGVVAPADKATGYIHTEPGQPAPKARTVVSTPMDLRSSADFVVVYSGTYYRDQLRELGIFPNVIAIDELGRHIVAAGLQDEIPVIRSDVDFNRLYRRHKPFLVLRTFTDERNNGSFLTMVMMNPKDLSEVFRAEIEMTRNVRLRTDQAARIPLFNSLLEWAYANGLKPSAQRQGG